MQNFTFYDLTFQMPCKMTELVSALSNAAYRMSSLCGTEAELEGGVQTLLWPGARVTAG